MTVLKKQIAQQVKGSLQEREDWWHLCYDTDSKEFFVEHEWHHMDAYNVSHPAHEGKEKLDANDYRGKGYENIEAAKAALLEEAGHT